MQTVAVNDCDSGSVLGGTLKQRQFSIHKNGGIQWEAGAKTSRIQASYRLFAPLATTPHY